MPPSERKTSPEEADDMARQEHEARVEHNKRTGGGAVQEGELDEQRDEHNRRTAGQS